MNFFSPDVLQVNHYIDALGARGLPATQFRYEDPPKTLNWAVDVLEQKEEWSEMLGGWSMFSLFGVCEVLKL